MSFRPRNQFFSILLVALSASSCTTSSKSSFKPQEGPNIAGVIRVFKNGQEVTKTCKVCFESQFSCYQLDEGGQVILTVEYDSTYIKRVRCDTDDIFGVDQSYSKYDLKIEKIRGPVSYFGDVILIYGEMKLNFNWSEFGLEIAEALITGWTSKYNSVKTGHPGRVFIKDALDSNRPWIVHSINQQNTIVRKGLLTGFQPTLIE